MSLNGFTLNLEAFETSRGPVRLDQETGSTYNDAVAYRVSLPTGASRRSFIKGNASVSIIDPNGEGTCQPRLVATGSLSVTIIDDQDAPVGAPFTTNQAAAGDVTAIATFLGDQLSAEVAVASNTVG